MPEYSKAPRGLFVLVDIGRVFTAIAISPSECSRQLLARYAIRAGLNLPDKEFRYLRTVIVTAAVHQGLISELWTEVLTPPRDLLALGRRQPLYILLRVCRDLCFW